jgi:hypothetical protein
MSVFSVEKKAPALMRDAQIIVDYCTIMMRK